MNCSSNSLLSRYFYVYFKCYVCGRHLSICDFLVFCLSLQFPAKCLKSQSFRRNLGISSRNIRSRDTYRYSSFSALPHRYFALFGSSEKPTKWSCSKAGRETLILHLRLRSLLFLVSALSLCSSLHQMSLL